MGWLSRRGLVVAALAIVAAGGAVVAWSESGTSTSTEGDGGSAGPVPDGATLFRAKGCAVCHVASDIAPDLGNLSERAGDRVEGLSAEAYVEQSIRDPGAYRVEPYDGSLMPMLDLTDEEIDALVEYLMGS